MLLQKSNSRYHLTIPIEVIKFLGWEKGKDLGVFLGSNQHELVIREINQTPSKKSSSIHTKKTGDYSDERN